MQTESNFTSIVAKALGLVARYWTHKSEQSKFYANAQQDIVLDA